MAKRRTREPDQLARLGSELQEGTWHDHARQRSQRRKSGWNLLLPLIAFPTWGGTFVLLSWLASALHTSLHPVAAPLFGGQLRMGAALVLIPCLVASVFPAFVLANFLVYLIPPARRAMDAEDRAFPGTGYNASQGALIRMGLWAFVICLPLMLAGALLRG